MKFVNEIFVNEIFVNVILVFIEQCVFLIVREPIIWRRECVAIEYRGL